MEIICRQYTVTEKQFSSDKDLDAYLQHDTGRYIDVSIEPEEQFRAVEVYDHQKQFRHIAALTMGRNREIFYVTGQILLLIANRSVFCFCDTWEKQAELSSEVKAVIRLAGGKLLLLCDTGVCITDASGVVLQEKIYGKITDYRYVNEMLELATETGLCHIDCKSL